MDFTKMTIADLKAAYDFSKGMIEECLTKAKKEGVPVEKVPVYKDWVEIEGKLYDELNNRILLS